MYAGRKLFHDLAVEPDTTPQCIYPGCIRIIERIVRIRDGDIQISDSRTPRMVEILTRLQREPVPAATNRQARATISTLLRELANLMTCTTHSNHAVRFAEMWERDFYFGRHAEATRPVIRRRPQTTPTSSTPTTSMPTRSTPTYSIPLKQSTLDVWDLGGDVVTITSGTQKIRVILGDGTVQVQHVESGNDPVDLVRAPAQVGRASAQGGGHSSTPISRVAPPQGAATVEGRQASAPQPEVVPRPRAAPRLGAESYTDTMPQRDTRPDAVMPGEHRSSQEVNPSGEGEPRNSVLSDWERMMTRNRLALDENTEAMDIDSEDASPDAEGVALDNVDDRESNAVGHDEGDRAGPTDAEQDIEAGANDEDEGSQRVTEGTAAGVAAGVRADAGANIGGKVGDGA